MVTDDQWLRQLHDWNAVKVRDDKRSKYSVYRLSDGREVSVIKVSAIKPEDRARELRAFARQHGLSEPVFDP